MSAHLAPVRDSVVEHWVGKGAARPARVRRSAWRLSAAPELDFGYCGASVDEGKTGRTGMRTPYIDITRATGVDDCGGLG